MRFLIIFFFISDTPIQYFFYKPDKDFSHFHYVYNLIRNCTFRVENIRLGKEQKNDIMAKDVVIKIGIAGNFHEDNLHLISGETCTVVVNKHNIFLYLYNVSDVKRSCNLFYRERNDIRR